MFKNEKEMIKRAIFLPAGGYFYTGHPWVAIVPAIAELILVIDVAVLLFAGISKPNAMVDIVGTLVFLAVFGVLKQRLPSCTAADTFASSFPGSVTQAACSPPRWRVKFSASLRQRGRAVKGIFAANIKAGSRENASCTVLGVSSKNMMCFKMKAACLLLVIASPCIAQEQLLKNKFVGKTLVIRNFYTDSELRYDEFGHIKNSAQEGDWTMAQFQIEKVKVKNRSFELSGKRVSLGYDQKHDGPVLFRMGDLSVKVDLPPTALSASKIDELGDQIFVDLNKESDQVPAYWRDLVSGNVVAEKKADGKTVYRLKYTAAKATTPLPPGTPPTVAMQTAQGIPIYLGNGLKSPIPVKTPDPTYSDVARKLGYEGTSILTTVVDENGEIEKISVVRTLGFGLDEKAVQAVKKWIFKPATLDGRPVKVMINIEVNFRLY